MSWRLRVLGYLLALGLVPVLFAAAVHALT